MDAECGLPLQIPWLGWGRVRRALPLLDGSDGRAPGGRVCLKSQPMEGEQDTREKLRVAATFTSSRGRGSSSSPTSLHHVHLPRLSWAKSRPLGKHKSLCNPNPLLCWGGGALPRHLQMGGAKAPVCSLQALLANEGASYILGKLSYKFILVPPECLKYF